MAAAAFSAAENQSSKCCGTKLTSFHENRGNNEAHSLCTEMPKGFSPKKGKILPSACHYSPSPTPLPPTTATKMKTLCRRVMRCLEGVFRLDQEQTNENKNPTKATIEKHSLLVEIYVSPWVRVCVHVFILDAGERAADLGRINFVTGRRKWIRDSDQGCTPRFLLKGGSKNCRRYL